VDVCAVCAVYRRPTAELYSCSVRRASRHGIDGLKQPVVSALRAFWSVRAPASEYSLYELPRSDKQRCVCPHSQAQTSAAWWLPRPRSQEMVSKCPTTHLCAVDTPNDPTTWPATLTSVATTTQPCAGVPCAHSLMQPCLQTSSRHAALVSLTSPPLARSILRSASVVLPGNMVRSSSILSSSDISLGSSPLVSAMAIDDSGPDRSFPMASRGVALFLLMTSLRAAPSPSSISVPYCTR